MYKVGKDQVICFGFRTQYGGGKSTGFGLIYDSNEALKKFEPRYRLVRIGAASKIEKASRQQRTFTLVFCDYSGWVIDGKAGLDEGGAQDREPGMVRAVIG